MTDVLKTQSTNWTTASAILFDLDGVLTPTATVHEQAWKELFEGFLASRPDVPGYREGDYFDHIDGKPRFDGVRDFLASRGIVLPEGAPSDGTAGQSSAEDAGQDAALGSRRGDELPEELKRRTDRLAKIQEAKARLETAARVQAEEEQRRRDDEQAQREAEGRSRRGKEPAPVDPTPADKAQTNFTDPEAKIMKQSNKGFDYSYNAQAVVDGENQIIVAAEVTDQANDKQQAVPMAQAALDNVKASGIARPVAADGTPMPIRNTADSGDFSGEAVGHRLLAPLAGVSDQPFHRQGIAALRTNFDRHLVGGATDTAALHLEDRLDVVHCLLEDVHRSLAGLLFDDSHRLEENAFRCRLLAVIHQAVDELAHRRRSVLRIRGNLALN